MPPQSHNPACSNPSHPGNLSQHHGPHAPNQRDGKPPTITHTILHLKCPHPPIPLWRAFHKWVTIMHPTAPNTYPHIKLFLHAATIHKSNTTAAKSQVAIQVLIPAYDTILMKWAITRAQHTMPKKPPTQAPPTQNTPTNATAYPKEIIQQLLNIITAQSTNTAPATTIAAHNETSPEHQCLLSLCRLTDIEKIPPFWTSF